MEVARSFPSQTVLYVNPLQQGLKRSDTVTLRLFALRSLCESITTRIETLIVYQHQSKGLNVLYVNPLQQGLKHRIDKSTGGSVRKFFM